MKNKLWKRVVTASLVISLLVPTGSQIAYAESKYVVLESHWEDGSVSRIETLYKDGVT